MNKFFVASILILCCIIFSDCQRKHLKQIATSAQVKKKKRKTYTNTQKADFRYLTTKSKIEFTDGLVQFTANATIRVAKDSVIWVSVSPALGVEVLRCLITKDSVFVINKFQKEYYIYSHKQLTEKLKFDINFNLVQSVFLGNPPYAEVEEDSSNSGLDTSYTIIKQKRKNIYADNFIIL